MTTDIKQVFVDVLTEMKALAEPLQRRMLQRHEPWVDLFREQVDIAPGKGTPKRVVDVRELAEILTLANHVSFLMHLVGTPCFCAFLHFRVFSDQKHWQRQLQGARLRPGRHPLRASGQCPQRYPSPTP